jgi:hypothetical protein
MYKPKLEIDAAQKSDNLANDCSALWSSQDGCSSSTEQLEARP